MDAVSVNANVCSRLAQLVDDRVKAVGAGLAQRDLSASSGDGSQIGAGFDAVGHDPVFAAVQAVNPVNGDGVGAGAADVCAHGDQTVGEIHHFRFARRVFEDGGAVSKRCRHQKVLGTRDGDHVHHDARAAEARDFGH